METAGAFVAHAADERARAGLLANFIGAENRHGPIAELRLQPRGFFDRMAQRFVIVRGLDLATAREACLTDAERVDRLLDAVDRLMRERVHAPRHILAVRRRD